jgi:single-strand DNA-binding protein
MAVDDAPSSYALLISEQSRPLSRVMFYAVAEKLLPRDGNCSRRDTHQGVDMNSFTITAVGNLAEDPELLTKGETAYTQICLIGNDYAGKDEQGHAREAVTSLYFVAFDSLGESIAKHSRKGDQLIVQAQIRSNNWIDRDGKKHYDYSNVIQNFRFGAPGRAKREEFAGRRSEIEMDALETEI